VRLVMALKVRDEEDILEDNLRYHAARGVDFFVVTDNGSVDGTLDILRRWEEDGRLRLIERPDEKFNPNEQAWVSEMARLAATDHDADWVLHNDADEFWWPLEGTLRDALGGIDARYGVVIVPRVNFVGRPDDGGSFTERLTVREAYTPIAPHVAHRARADAVLVKGAHSVDVEAAWGGEQAYSTPRFTYAHLPRTTADPPLPPDDPFVPSPRFPIRIFHFPLRSSAQYERRLRGYFDGGYSPGVVGRLRARLEDEGIERLYGELALDDDEIAAGIREGRLVRDRRLGSFLAHLADPHASLSPAPSPQELEREIEEVRFDALAGLGRMHRSLHAWRDQASRHELELRRELRQARKSLRRAKRRGLRGRLRTRLRRLRRA